MERWEQVGFDRRFVDEGLVRDLGDGTVWVEPRLLAQVPGADLAFNVVTGDSLEYANVRTDMLPKDYWQSMQGLLSNYDRSTFTLTCPDCKVQLPSGSALAHHRCVAMAKKPIHNNIVKEATVPDKPDPLAEEEQEWVVRAIRRKAEGKTPEVGTEKVDASGERKVRRGSAEKVFSAILNHGGGAVTVQQLVEDTGLARQQVHNGCHYLVTKGIVIRLMTGIYQVHPDAVKLSERVNVDVRHHDVIASAPPQAAQTPQDARSAPPAPEVPQPAPRPAQSHSDADAGLIQAVLELVAPDGFQARHYPAIQAWWEATAKLLSVLES